MPKFQPSLAKVAHDAECDADVARAAVGSALRMLHRVAVTDPRNVTAALTEAYYLFGPEACYHFAGLLEVSRTETDPDIPWSETINRFAPHLRPYRGVVERWMETESLGSPDDA